MNGWRRGFGVLAVVFCFVLWSGSNGAFGQASMEELERRIQELEKKLEKYEKKEEISKVPVEDVGGVKGIEERAKAIEKMVEGIEFSGLIEVEANYQSLDHKDPADPDTDSSDLNVAKVELGVDAGITNDIKGHLLFLYEDDEDVVVDEAIIHIRAEEVCVPDESCSSPWYASLGKLYVPFGYFESHFISDPLTLQLGETRETAVVAGLANQWANAAAGAFNGDVNETDENDDHIDNYVATARLTLPSDLVTDVSLVAGVSYINNIAESETLQDADGVNGGTVTDYVGGFSAFVSAAFMERLFFEAEYLGATDEFEDGELAFGTGKLQPKAWNFELAYGLLEDLEVAAKYEGGDDLGTFLPEKQYGAAVTYGLAENTAVSLEYLYGEFENDDERDLATAQFAIEF